MEKTLYARWGPHFYGTAREWLTNAHFGLEVSFIKLWNRPNRLDILVGRNLAFGSQIQHCNTHSLVALFYYKLGTARVRRFPLPEIVLWTTASQHPSESQTSECSDLLSRSRATFLIAAQRQPGKLNHQNQRHYWCWGWNLDEVGSPGLPSLTAPDHYFLSGTLGCAFFLHSFVSMLP